MNATIFAYNDWKVKRERKKLSYTQQKTNPFIAIVIVVIIIIIVITRLLQTRTADNTSKQPSTNERTKHGDNKQKKRLALVFKKRK